MTPTQILIIRCCIVMMIFNIGLLACSHSRHKAPEGWGSQYCQSKLFEPKKEKKGPKNAKPAQKK